MERQKYVIIRILETQTEMIYKNIRNSFFGEDEVSRFFLLSPIWF